MVASLLTVYLRLQGEQVSRIAKAMCLTSDEYTKTIVCTISYEYVGLDVLYERPGSP